ncbi:ABC transporter permease [Pseudalkalibacillus hwajinpoensis]|uniref:ABC transporter permease n=1 Tax=Guptibacillus hwajinpoensis TaxID=208199 RepID=UPI001CFC800A|nr:iron export ABC transporter permease subunit FetB [Pseudalkalibacillus hwajinpoensis]
MTNISNLSLLTMILFVMIPVSLSYLFSLGIGKSAIWSSIRGVVQLFFIGYVLTFLFSMPDWQGIGLWVAVMLVIASLQAAKRGKGIPYAFLLSLSSLILIEVFVLSLWIAFDIIPFQSEQVIPMSGMIIGNSMVATGLAFERMKNEFHDSKGKILAALSLGANASQASKMIIRKTIRAAMIPNVDGLKTIGLVQLPGMMTGLILGGASPIEAIRYQIVISISIFSSVSICAMIISLVTYRFFFNRKLQLLEGKGGRK